MSPSRFSVWRMRSAGITFSLLLLVLLYGCDAIAGTLPPGPTPFPTFARLPSVTPEPPTPSPGPFSDPFPTVTPRPLTGTVMVGANVRTGPGTNFAIITTIVAGHQVTLRGQSEGWYQVVTPDGIEGWMSESVLNVAPSTAANVPVVSP